MAVTLQEAERKCLPVLISKAGNTRSPVVVIGPLALKFAKNGQGRDCNLYEAALYRRANEERRALLCPVLWVSSHGAILIMRTAIPLLEEEMMSDEDYVKIGNKWRNAAPDDEPDPFEPGPHNWGWLEGRIVSIDYSKPAWENVEWSR